MTRMSRRRIKAVVWDLDGTLVDSVQMVFRATRYAVDRCVSHPVSDEFLWSLFGRPVTEVWPLISAEHFRELEAHFEDYYARHRSDLVKPVPGVRETLDVLHGAGIGMAVLSNKRKDQGLEELAAAGLERYFEYVLFSEDLPHAKPEPDGLLMTLDHFGITPPEALMVGDGVMDILCAKNAGVPAVAAVWAEWAQRQRSTLEALSPDFILDDVRDLWPLVSPE